VDGEWFGWGMQKPLWLFFLFSLSTNAFAEKGWMWIYKGKNVVDFKLSGQGR